MGFTIGFRCGATAVIALRHQSHHWSSPDAEDEETGLDSADHGERATTTTKKASAPSMDSRRLSSMRCAANRRPRRAEAMHKEDAAIAQRLRRPV